MTESEVRYDAKADVLYLFPKVDQQEEAGSRQAFHQGVQEHLGFGIDPVQILDDEQHRPQLTFAHEDSLERVQDALVALGRLERSPLRVFEWHLEERQQCRRGGREGLIEAMECSGNLVPDGCSIIAVSDAEVALEQVKQRQIGVAWPYAVPCVSRVSHGCTRPPRTNSSHRRDMPTPGSPIIPSTCPRPPST
jgi:hypothetical protein